MLNEQTKESIMSSLKGASCSLWLLVRLLATASLLVAVSSSTAAYLDTEMTSQWHESRICCLTHMSLQDWGDYGVGCDEYGGTDLRNLYVHRVPTPPIYPPSRCPEATCVVV